MMDYGMKDVFDTLMTKNAAAYAQISGQSEYNDLYGYIFFMPLWDGTLVIADIHGLPEKQQLCTPSFFGFHIHENESHYNPGGCGHPAHAGDLPPLLGKDGIAWQMFYSGYFTPEEIIGKTIIIHQNPDDFTTQPSGNSGEKIGTGVIKAYRI